MPLVAAASELDPVVAALRSGAVVAIPTDTVYGVAVALSAGPAAPAALFEAKQRPAGVALPVLVADRTQAAEVGDGLGDAAEGLAARLAERFWPGPLTLVVPRRAELHDVDLGGDATTVGLRCPDDELVRHLAREVGPLATTSANLHGRPPCTTAAEVVEQLGDAVAVVVDGGRRDGVPSTVVDCRDGSPRVLREGAIAARDIEELA